MVNIFYKVRTVNILFLIAGLFFLPLFTYSQRTGSKGVAPATVAPPLVVPDTSKNSLLLPVVVRDTGKNSSDQYLTLKQCIDYALIHQPFINEANINVDVAKTTNAISLAGWLPQVNSSGTLTHYIQRTNSNITTTTQGFSSNSVNTFVPGVAVSQAIFSPGLLYASKSAPLYVKQAQQATDSTKIFVVSSVSKTFYTLLNTLEQINVFKEDTARLGRSLRDAYIQYKGGIVDETDYEQAAITLNNSKAQLKQANENVVPQYASLKRLMGFPPEKQFNVVFDTLQMRNAIQIDTTEQLQYEKRIELQEIRTSEDLQSQLQNYYRFSWLPTLSAFNNYNLYFAKNNYNNLLS
ncbi:MAG: oprM 3, partial [Mucilaginibacter sp.]|nr:oprM 3 [Mucilaginibacter sp.]